MGIPLTRIQAKVLEAVRRRIDRGQPAPTYRDLCAEFGWGSTGTVRDHLRALKRKGYLELSGAHRGLRLREQRPALARVPLVGRVIAGTPIASDENIDATIAVPAEWAARGSYFALRVSGDSMQDAGILEGDEVVVRKQATANNGDIVVATLDGETTLKRFQMRGSRATLIAENSRYRPIDIRTEFAMIQGVVVGLMRAYRHGTMRGAKAYRTFKEAHAHRA